MNSASAFACPAPLGSAIAVLLMCVALYGLFYVSYNQADEFMSQLPKYSGRIRSRTQPGAAARRPLRQTTRNVLPEEKLEKGTLTVRQIQQLDSTN